jgi:hypothetical protein
MRKNLAGLLGLVTLFTIVSTRAHAQVSKGYSDVGVVVGFGNLSDASLSFGGRYENVFKKLPDLANGLLGFEVSADVYSYSRSGASVRYIPIGATANYHFPIDPKNKVDLFLGAGLGFQSVSCSGFGTRGCGFNSALYVIGRAGGRYFFSPRTALYADLGAGAAAINVGLTFKMK